VRTAALKDATGKGATAKGAAVALAGLALAGCDGLVTNDTKSVFALVDVSGTYFAELPDSVRGAKLLASSLNAGDSLTVAAIGSCSFDDDAIAVDRRLPDRPSEAAAVKASALSELDAYQAVAARTEYTDIHGALLQAIDRFSRDGAGRHVVVIFSDLVEDPAPGCGSAAAPLNLAGVTVIAANVIKLRADAEAPDAYFARLDGWRAKVEDAGGRWILVDDVEALRNAAAGA
jgi:hypothetical protein